MRKTGFTLVELLIVLVIIGILASLLVPALVEAIKEGRMTYCLNNLRQIGDLSEVYRKSFGGQGHELPSQTGIAWHQKLIETTLRGRDPGVFQCPLEGSDAFPDYRGPAKNVNLERNYELDDPIAGDKIDLSGQTNHGDPDRYGVNALTKSHSIQRITRGDAARWARYVNGTTE